jgi:hypothetical protein
MRKRSYGYNIALIQWENEENFEFKFLYILVYWRFEKISILTQTKCAEKGLSNSSKTKEF